MSKQLTEIIARVAKRKAGKCDTCLGDGDLRVVEPFSSPAKYMKPEPCPTCARIREIAEWKWRELETENNGIAYVEHKYGITNPTYTVQTLRAVLEDLGEWERFNEHLFDRWRREGLDDDIIYLTLTSDELMSQAVLNFLEVCDE
jgi:arsenate reductase-like glutaredoxin family protein